MYTHFVKFYTYAHYNRCTKPYFSEIFHKFNLNFTLAQFLFGVYQFCSVYIMLQLIGVKPISLGLNISQYRLSQSIIPIRNYSDKIKLFNVEYKRDDWTNINKNISDKLSRNLLHQKYHPLNHLMNKIKHYFNKTYVQSSTPMFTVFDNFKPVVTLEQNFDRFSFIKKLKYQLFISTTKELFNKFKT